MADAQAKFLTGNLFMHTTRMALTASLGLMAVFLVDFIDMIFIAMLGKSELAAAVGYAAAVLFFATSFGIGLAIAAGALVARALGAGDADLARARTTHALFYGIVFSVTFSACLWVNLDVLVALLGAKGETAELSVHFLKIVIPAVPIQIVGMMGGAVLRAHGDARRAMLSTIVGSSVNAALDPILIFGLDLELTGAALASVAARIVIAVLALLPLTRVYQALARPQIRGLIKDFIPIFAIAFPVILAQLATPVGQAFVTRAMAQFGEAAVAGMAIVGRLVPVAFGVIFALSGSVGPIIGQNYGAGNQDRMRASYRAALWFTAIVVVLVSAILFLSRGALADLFDAQGITQDLIYLFCGPLALLFFFPGVLFVSSAVFNNLGTPFLSTFVNWGRNALALIPLVWIGAYFFGPLGVLIGQALAGVLFGIVAWILARRTIENRGQSEPPKPQAFRREGRLLTLFQARR